MTLNTRITISVRNLFLLLCVLLVCGCQATTTVLWSSDPPGAYASGRYKDGTNYRQPLPFRIVYGGAELPRDFPATCAVVSSPTITWPDGTTKETERVRLCFKDNTYVSKKPYSAPSPSYSPPVEVNKAPPLVDKQERPPSTDLKIRPDPQKEAQKKCLRLGLKPGSDDYNLCIGSSVR